MQLLKDNNEIMSSDGLLQWRCGLPTTLCIGAAAISITQSREQGFDFLTSYFTNNVRILAPASTDPVDMLVTILSAVWQLLLGLVVFALAFWLLLTPIVWAFEMLALLGGGAPIFLPPRGSKNLVLGSLKAAAVWTYLTFQGAQLARPSSAAVRAVLLPLLLAGTKVIGITATAAMAAIFTLDATKVHAACPLSPSPALSLPLALPLAPSLALSHTSLPSVSPP